MKIILEVIVPIYNDDVVNVREYRVNVENEYDQFQISMMILL